MAVTLSALHRRTGRSWVDRRRTVQLQALHKLEYAMNLIRKRTHNFPTYSLKPLSYSCVVRPRSVSRSELRWTLPRPSTPYDKTRHTFQVHGNLMLLFALSATWRSSRFAPSSGGLITYVPSYWTNLALCNIWGFHGGDYEECRLVGYKTPVLTS
jgi:hypothetical protein